MVAAEAGRVEPSRGLELGIDVTSCARIQSASPLSRASNGLNNDLHNHSTVPIALFFHEVHGELAGELDKPVVASLGHDEHTLDV